MKDERKEKLIEIRAKLTAMTEAQRKELAAQIGIVTIEGRRLSDYNQCFLMYQRQGNTVVGGYKQWKAAGRQVVKGQHGMSIYIPTGTRDEKGALINEDMRFWFATVFDISQTEPITVEAEKKAA